MTGLGIVVAWVLRWVAEGLLWVADWVDRGRPVHFVESVGWGEHDAEIVPLYGRSRRG